MLVKGYCKHVTKIQPSCWVLQIVILENDHIISCIFFLTNFCEGKDMISRKHKPLFKPISLYLVKKHIWRFKMFHKTICKAWNIFKHLEQLLKNSTENSILQVWIDHEESSIDRRLFLIDPIGIDHQSNMNRSLIEVGRDSRIIFLHHFDRLSKMFDWLNILNFEFHLENFRTWIFTLWNNILQTQISLL